MKTLHTSLTMLYALFTPSRRSAGWFSVRLHFCRLRFFTLGPEFNRSKLNSPIPWTQNNTRIARVWIWFKQYLIDEPITGTIREQYHQGLLNGFRLYKQHHALSYGYNHQISHEAKVKWTIGFITADGHFNLPTGIHVDMYGITHTYYIQGAKNNIVRIWRQMWVGFLNVAICMAIMLAIPQAWTHVRHCLHTIIPNNIHETSSSPHK